MSGRASWLMAPVVGAIYVGLLAPPVVIVGVSFGPSAAFAFPPTGFTLHWFAEFFASDAYVRSFFRVSLIVGLLSGTIATLFGTAAALGLAAPAHADPDLDARFLDALTKAGLTVISAPGLPSTLTELVWSWKPS